MLGGFWDWEDCHPYFHYNFLSNAKCGQSRRAVKRKCCYPPEVEQQKAPEKLSKPKKRKGIKSSSLIIFQRRAEKTFRGFFSPATTGESGIFHTSKRSNSEWRNSRILKPQQSPRRQLMFWRTNDGRFGPRILGCWHMRMTYVLAEKQKQWHALEEKHGTTPIFIRLSKSWYDQTYHFAIYSIHDSWFVNLNAAVINH